MPLNRSVNDRLCCLDSRVEDLETSQTNLAVEVEEIQTASTAPADYTLVGGSVAIADTAVTATTKAMITRHTSGGTTGTLTYVSTAGVGVTITSSSGTDVSVLTVQLFY